MAGGIGSPISKGVVEELDRRKAVIGKATGRTNDDLLFITSKTGWIKLSSSVNTLTPEESEQVLTLGGRKSVNGSNTLAGYNILMGGLLDPNRGLRQGIDTTGAYNQSAVYNNALRSTGIRPMPGITSMTVKSKNTYGTLREAEVKFMVWTLDDFEMVEKLYLRPGFTILLEWGHSLYLNDKGGLEKTIETVPNQFFQNGITVDKITNSIRDIRKRSNNNYEGMLGTIKNFSWNYTANGGYECSVSIISTGEILESIQVRFDPQHRLPREECVDPTTTKGRKASKSMYHHFSQKLSTITSTPFTKADVQEVSETFASKLEDFTGYYHKAQRDDTGAMDDDLPIHWIPMRTILEIFNKHISMIDLSKPEDTPDHRYVNFNTKYTNQDGEYISSKYLTSDEHFSIDPLVCVLPKIATVTPIKAAPAPAPTTDQATVQKVVGPVDAYKVDSSGVVRGRETGGGI